MKFSELWLREWVNPSINTKSLTDQMTMFGLKVENVEPISSCFTGIVVGRIITCQQHPKFNEWHIIEVDIGRKYPLRIMHKSQKNNLINLRVAVATVDATLLSEDNKLLSDIIAQPYDEPSEGILCSYSDLGISESTDIIELSMDALIGQNIQDYLRLEDNIINVSVTPNRADCFSLLGIARDIAAYNRITLYQPTIKQVVPVINERLSIQVNAFHDCPRYLCRIIKNINIGASIPLWIKERLHRSGLQSINAIADITNYVLLELGQPIFFFDLKYIDGGIVVRQAMPNETLILSDGSEILLSLDTLVIADHCKILALAGILGDVSSNISPVTRDLVLECAFFNPLVITNSVHRYGLHTNASHRYEHGVDPELQSRAIERATLLLMTICGGEAGPISDMTAQDILPKPKNIHLRRSRLDQLIGYTISDSDITEILTHLGCQISQDGVNFKVITPSWRFDIVLEEDLIEEVTRMYGYNMLPNIPVHINLNMPVYNETQIPLTRVKTLLVDLGYQEVITYSFVDPKFQTLLHPNVIPLFLSNPLSQNMSSMRLSLWTGLLNTVVYNQNRQQKKIRLFESGLCFVPDDSADLGIRQDLMLAGAISGPKFDEHWDLTSQSVDFYDIKGDLESIFECTGKLNNIEFRKQNNPALHLGQSASIYIKNDFVGLFGLIHPQTEAQLHLNSHTLVFELFWEKIAERIIPQANDISRFPANRRDIAIVVKDSIAVGDIIEECKKIDKTKLVSVTLFDVYRGKGIEKGFKSLAISLILQDTTHTLNKEEISVTVEKCVAVLKQRFQASLRE